MVTSSLSKREKMVSPCLTIPSCRHLHIRRSGKSVYLCLPFTVICALPARDPVAVIEDEVPPLSSVDKALRKLMCENATHAFNFREGILAMGGLSPFYTICPKAYLSGNGESFAGCAMDVIPGDEVPHAEGQEMDVTPGCEAPLLERASLKGSEDS
ncbi:hypothetical protein HanLR1_Chr01g0023221 [Helianthus annuus]|nr:hypothetical protein HanLR1_Chr01g0023221 [Helianthus annuus]